MIDGVAHSKFHMSAVPVGVLFHFVLGISQVVFETKECLISLGKLLVQGGVGRPLITIKNQLGWGTTINNVERGSVDGDMVRSIVPIFRPRQPVVPLPRSLGAKTSEVCFNTLVDYFGLAIGLWVISCAPVKLSVPKAE